MEECLWKIQIGIGVIMNNTLIQILVLLFLILMNAFFAGSEIAFISLNQMKMKSKAEEGDRRAKKVVQLIESPTNFLSAIQIGVSLSSMLSGAFAADAFADGLARFIVDLSNGSLSFVVIRPLAMIFITFITMFMMLVFGELVPKRIAMSNAEKFAFFVIYPISFLSTLFLPLVRLLAKITNVCLRIVGIDPHQQEEVTEEEIRLLVEAGEIDLSEKEMIENVFEFDNLAVEDIMTHRTDIVAIDIDTDYEELMNTLLEERYTRYPVYEESIDNIIGIFHLRDILTYIQTHDTASDFNLRYMLREAYFVPESKRTDELFAELTLHKTHIAVVIDEYGGTAGIVTLEDLIEEIMGNIMDEYDEEEEILIEEVHPNEYLVEGYTDLDDLEKVLEIELPIEDYDTVSGFMIGVIGRLPTKEDILSDETDFEYRGYYFSIVDVDEKVISKVRIVKLEEKEQ